MRIKYRKKERTKNLYNKDIQNMLAKRAKSMKVYIQDPHTYTYTSNIYIHIIYI